jgi:anthranilate synthase component 1
MGEQFGAEQHPEHELQVFGLAEVQGLVDRGYDAIPLVEKLELRESAGAVYERLRGNGPSFLLESADPAEHQGRYSFIGINPETIIRLEETGMMVNGEAREFTDPYDFVDKMICKRNVAPVGDASTLVSDLPTFFGGAVGLFGYDLARYREPTIGKAKEDALGLPEMALMVPGITIAFDHYKQEVSIIGHVLAEPGEGEADVAASYQQATEAIHAVRKELSGSTGPVPEPAQTDYEPLSFQSNMSPEEFKDAVRSAKESAEAGDTFQIVPSQRFSSEQTVDGDFAYQVFKRLKATNPSRYGFLFEFGDFQAAGCSPEMLVKVRDGYVEHMAIAGTRRRGATPEENAALAHDLATDPKELAEHRMLVDLCRNDVNRVCLAESVEVETHAEVEQYSHVMHMTTKVHGQLKKGNVALDALASIAPAGTLSGAPKISAMQEIDKLEPDKRGFYGGAVGYVTYKGDLDSCIFIRSVLVDREGHVHVQAGAGVVADSDPEAELEETIIKARAPMRAIEEVCNPSVRHQSLIENGRRPSPTLTSARRVGSKVLLLDNYDSYTRNVSQLLEVLSVRVVVMRNDVAEQELIDEQPDFLVVSPGPHTPKEAGLSGRAMRYFPEMGKPALGICLGHQALAVAFGGEVGRYKAVHGKTADVEHDGRTIFSGLDDTLQVMRYHSLVVQPPLPPELERSAFTKDNGREIIMAIRHKELPAEGVQFHPESFYTPSGFQILENFLKQPAA